MAVAEEQQRRSVPIHADVPPTHSYVCMSVCVCVYVQNDVHMYLRAHAPLGLGPPQ